MYTLDEIDKSVKMMEEYRTVSATLVTFEVTPELSAALERYRSMRFDTVQREISKECLRLQSKVKNLPLRNAIRVHRNLLLTAGTLRMKMVMFSDYPQLFAALQPFTSTNVDGITQGAAVWYAQCSAATRAHLEALRNHDDTLPKSEGPSVERQLRL